MHQLTSIAHTYAVKSAYFEVIWIKKGLRIIPTHRARELKNVVDRSEMSCKCGGRGVDLTPFSLVALLQTLACNIGGHTHTHTPESLAARSIALHVLCFTSLKKFFHCVRIKKSRQNWFELTGSLFQNSH